MNTTKKENEDIGHVLSLLTACTPGSINSLFVDFFNNFWRGMLGGVRDYLGEVLADF